MVSRSVSDMRWVSVGFPIPCVAVGGGGLEIRKQRSHNHKWKCHRQRRCQDESGLVVDMFQHAFGRVHAALLDIYNDMLATGVLDRGWQTTLFNH